MIDYDVLLRLCNRISLFGCDFVCLRVAQSSQKNMSAFKMIKFSARVERDFKIKQLYFGGDPDFCRFHHHHHRQPWAQCPLVSDAIVTIAAHRCLSRAAWLNNSCREHQGFYLSAVVHSADMAEEAQFSLYHFLQ